MIRVTVGSEAQVSYSSGPSGHCLPADVVASALGSLDEESDVRAAMWEIRARHVAGRSTVADHRRYRACWRALAMRRARGHCVMLSAQFDEELDLRSALLDDIRHERARYAVDEVFTVAPEDGSPATGAEPVSR